MTAVAISFRKYLDHHKLENAYNKVTIDLNTHDADGIHKKVFN
jgi:pterin-4a-carbinolamine dehydratase